MESPIRYFTVMDVFRQLGKVKHKLVNIIAITITAVIYSCENWYEIEDYGKQKEPWLKTFMIYPMEYQSKKLIVVFLCGLAQRNWSNVL